MRLHRVVLKMTSRYHDGPCGPCFLCQVPPHGGTKYTHPEKLKENEYELLKKFENTIINRNACICLACVKQIKRNAACNNTSFHPRWRPKPTMKTPICTVENCTKTVYRNTNLAATDEVELLLGQRVTAQPEGELSLGLCQEHYQKLYAQLHPPVVCDSCGARAKMGEEFTRHCPAPESINSHMESVISEPCHLSHASIICYTCYKYFNGVLKEQQEVEVLNIEKAIERISGKMRSVHSLKQPGEYYELVLCKAALKLAEAMKNDEVVLLPAIYREFRDEVKKGLTQMPHLVSLSRSIPGTRWVLTRLYHYFGKSLQVQCKHRKYGSLLFHQNCDLVKAISTALGKTSRQASRPDPLIAPLASCPDPLIAPLASRPDPVMAPLASRLDPLMAPLASRPDSLIAPLASRPDPVMAPLASRLDPLMAPLASRPDPVMAPLALLLNSLFIYLNFLSLLLTYTCSRSDDRFVCRTIIPQPDQTF